jgi:phosphate-selective porin OprO/OprP
MRPSPGSLAAWLMAAALMAPPATSQGKGDEPVPADSTLERTIEAGESNVESPRRKLVKWNEYESPYFTLRAGAGFLYEGAAYAQDDDSREQFDLQPDAKVRDFRLLLKGRIKFQRPTTWTCGIMYDGPTDAWLVRETGIMVAIPEIWGHLFVGRTKEGTSLNKVMSGYAGWTMERAAITDATIPILADGVKWLGYVPGHGVIWNIGWYHDWLSEEETFSTYDSQFVMRLAWLPIVSEETGTLLHLGVNGRYGRPDEGQIRMRSRPEAFPAPYFVETASFAAGNTRTASVEAYYRPGPLLLGSEYFLIEADAPESGNPLFHGGDVVASWLVTGETRAYNTVGGYFKAVSPARTVFEGGPGAWEAVLRLSYIDLDSGALRGGRFWRLTPMVNWHLSDNVRLEFTYGYGTLDRFGLTGATQFFQSRIQLQL